MMTEDYNVEQYLIDIERFPELPKTIEDESLKFLKIQIQDQPMNSKRNFVSYMLIHLPEDIFDRFVDLYLVDRLEEFDEIMPYC